VRIGIDAWAAAEVPAGRGRYVREVLRSLARLQDAHEYVLFAHRDWDEARLAERMRWRSLPQRGMRWPLAAARAMSRECDVGLGCTSYALPAAATIPAAAIVWDLAPFDRALRTPRASLFERVTLPFAVRRCEALIAISEATRTELCARFPAASAKTTVAHPAADEIFSPTTTTDDDAVLERHKLRRPFALVTGTLEPRKNLPRLIEAFAGLPEHLRAGWTLALAGAVGWDTQETFASVARHRDLLHTLGYVSDHDLAALYRQADVFCYPSLYEGFGIPVLEAMQSGTAVLTSDRSSLPEVGGNAARYADPTSVADLRRGLLELIADPGLRARCATAGISQAHRFTWEATAEHIRAVLTQIARR
jgi:glycosyltransferase involved in cell wall biosynthesis